MESTYGEHANIKEAPNTAKKLNSNEQCNGIKQYPGCKINHDVLNLTHELCKIKDLLNILDKVSVFSSHCSRSTIQSSLQGDGLLLVGRNLYCAVKSTLHSLKRSPIVYLFIYEFLGRKKRAGSMDRRRLLGVCKVEQVPRHSDIHLKVQHLTLSIFNVGESFEDTQEIPTCKAKETLYQMIKSIDETRLVD